MYTQAMDLMAKEAKDSGAATAPEARAQRRGTGA